MNSEETSEFRKLTEDRLHYLTNIINDTDSHDRENKLADEEDRTFQLNNTEVGNQVIAKARKELTALLLTRAWLLSENAGLCEECGNEIPYERLKALLSSRLCQPCAAKRDGGSDVRS